MSRYTTVIILFLAYPLPAEQVAVTLAEAVRIALERHPDVGKARAGVDLLKGRIREVRAPISPAGGTPAC